MNKKTLFLFYTFFSMFLFVAGEILYLQTVDGRDKNIEIKKNRFVALSGLSDLCISTEAGYVRHRSISDLFSIYKDDPSLREYFPSTYAISHAKITNYEN